MTVLALLRCMPKTAFEAAIHSPFMPTNLGSIITGCIAKTCGNVQVPAVPLWDFGDHVLPQKCGWTWLQLYPLSPTSVLNASAFFVFPLVPGFPPML